MKRKNDKSHVTLDALSLLEGLDETFSADKVDASLLKKGDMHKELSALEKVNAKERLAVMGQRKFNPLNTPLEKEHDIIEELDVSLREVIQKVFDPSDKVFLIIRDDDIFYANDTFCKLIGFPNRAFIAGKKFLSFVAKKDWDLMAENIGEMLTNGKQVSITLRLAKKRLQKMKFEAIHLNDRQSFMFILAGEKVSNQLNKPGGFHDDVTGLPSFHLLSDRAQVAINNENNRDTRLKKNLIALVGIDVRNPAQDKNIPFSETVLRKIATKLAFNTKATYTISRGVKHHFWILMPDLPDIENLYLEVKKFQALFNEPISDDLDEYNFEIRVGVSVFPDTASSSKKLFEQAISALKQATMSSAGKIIFFKGE